MAPTAFLPLRPVVPHSGLAQNARSAAAHVGPRTRPAGPTAVPTPAAPAVRAAPSCCVEMPAWKRMTVDTDFAKNEQLQILEDDLDTFLQREDFARASELQDKLTRLQSGSFVEVLSANLKFYSAINKRSVVDMAGCWMQRDDVICKLPFSDVVGGYINTINHFGYLFTFDFNPVEVASYRIVMRGSVGYVTCEEVVTDDDGNKMKSYATNIFEKRNGQWYIIHYTSMLM